MASRAAELLPAAEERSLEDYVDKAGLQERHRSGGSGGWRLLLSRLESLQKGLALLARAQGRHGNPRPWMWLGFGQPFFGRKVSKSLGRWGVKLAWPAWLDHGTSQAARSVDSRPLYGAKLDSLDVLQRVPGSRNLRIVTCDVSKVPLVDAALPVLKKERPEAEGFDRVVSVEMMENFVRK